MSALTPLLGRVLVADDEFELMTALVEALTAQGYEASGFESGPAALEALRTREFDLLLTDLMMPGMDGIALLKAGLEIDPYLIGVVMTGQGTVPTAVEAMKIGAFDYLLKPFRLDAMLPVLARAMEVRRLRVENIQLRETISIYNLSQVIAFSLDSALIGQKTVEAAAQQVGADEVSLMLVTPAGDELVVAAVLGAGREALLGRRLPFEQGIAGWVARQNEPLILNGEVRDARFAPVLPRADILSAISMPMLAAGQLVGVLNVNSLRQRRPFNLGQVKALSILTGTAASALHSAALYAESERLRRYNTGIVETMAEGLTLEDAHGQITFANARLLSLLGYTAAELIGQPWHTIVARREHARAAEQAAQNSPGQPHTYESLLIAKDGREIPVQVSATPFEAGGPSAGILATFADLTTRQQAEAALAESEARFRSWVENAMDVITVVDLQGTIVYESPSAEHLLGYTPAEMVGRSAFEFVHPDDQARLLDLFVNNVQTAGAQATAEFRMRDRAGQWRDFEANGQSIPDWHGQAVGLIHSRDISERKRAEEARARLVDIIEASPDFVGWANADGRVVYINHAGRAMLGLGAAEDLTGTQIADYAPAWVNNLILREAIGTAIATGSWTGESALLTRAGREIPVSQVVVAHHGAGGEVLFISTMARDISASRQAAETSLLQSAALNSVVNGIVITDPSGTIEWINPAVTAMTGYTAAEALGKNPRDLFRSGQNDAAVYKDLWDTLRAGQAWHGELINRRKNGGLYTEDQTITPILNADGQVTHFVAIKQDISARKQAEVTLSESEARLRTLFENTPISIWEEDFSAVKDYLDHLPDVPPGRLNEYLTDHPEAVAACIERVRVIDVNQTSVALLQAPDKAGLLGGLVQVLTPESRAVFQRELVAMALGERHVSADATVETLTGQRREVSLDWVVVPGHESDYARVLLSLVDITERKRAEQATERQLQRLAALRAIDMAISASLDLRLTLQIVLDHLVTQLQVDAADICLISASRLSMDYAAGRGFRTRDMSQTRLRLGQGLPGRVALERRLVAVPDMSLLEAGTQHLATLQAEGFRAYFGVPLIAQGQVTGVLEVYRRAPMQPEGEWLDFLEALAGQAAIAIDSATLVKDLQLSNQNLNLAYDATLEGWSRALDLRDHETEGHSRRVTELTLQLAQRMDIGKAELVHVHRGALLHDIGKMGIPDSVLLKPGPLTEAEWAVMHQHPVYAHDMLSPIQYLREALDIPYCHHEKWDGTGYPRHLKGPSIPLAARIFAVVDVWDALSSDRPYRLAWPEEKVMAYIRAQAGSHFDPKVVEVFEAWHAAQRQTDGMAGETAVALPGLLIVDDEDNVTRSLARSLRAEFTVFVAASGPAALELLAQQHIAVILTDQRMAGMTGLQLLQQAHDLSPATRGLLISGYTDSAALAETLSLDNTRGFVAKPWNMADLSHQLHAAARRYAELYRAG